MKYHKHIIKVIRPNDYNELDGPIYDIYDLKGNLIAEEGALEDAKFRIDNGYSIQEVKENDRGDKDNLEEILEGIRGRRREVQ